MTFWLKKTNVHIVSFLVIFLSFYSTIFPKIIFAKEFNVHLGELSKTLNFRKDANADYGKVSYLNFLDRQLCFKSVKINNENRKPICLELNTWSEDQEGILTQFTSLKISSTEA